MNEVLLRALVIGGAVAAAAIAVRIGSALQNRKARATALDLSDIDGRLVLLTERSCSNCDEVRRLLEDRDVVFSEVAYEDDSARMERIGVTDVPLLVARDDSGVEVGRIAGLPRRRALARLLAAVESG